MPKDDDVGPIISELQKENRELGRLETEFKNLEELEMQEKSLVSILNSKIREIFVSRSRIVSEIRQFLGQKGYLEVETPMMHPIAGGATARPIKTHHAALDMAIS